MINTTVIPAYTSAERETINNHLQSILSYHKEKVVPKMHEGDIVEVEANDLTAVFFQNGQIVLKTKVGTFSFMAPEAHETVLISEYAEHGIPFLMQWEDILADLRYAIEQRAKEVKFLMNFSVEPKTLSAKFI